jgi:hypothetical protein
MTAMEPISLSSDEGESLFQEEPKPYYDEETMADPSAEETQPPTVSPAEAETVTSALMFSIADPQAYETPLHVRKTVHFLA